MKKLASERVISSQKGPAGGFACNEITRSVSLLQLAAMTNETNQFGSCLLRLRKCNPQNPCPLHHQAQVLKDQWLNLLCYTTIGQLVEGEHKNFIGSITAA